jgi:hypothetical protein
MPHAQTMQLPIMKRRRPNRGMKRPVIGVTAAPNR